MSDEIDGPSAEIIQMPRDGQARPVHRSRTYIKLRAVKCFKEVHQMLLDGFGPAAVADFIQKEKKEYTDVTRSSLIYTLRKYRSEIPAVDQMKAKLPDHVEKAEAKVRSTLNELDELQDLYLLQRNRIDIDYKLEKQVKKLIPTTNQEIRTATEILRTSAQLKVDIGMTAQILGGNNNDPSLAETLAKKVTNAAVAKVLEDPQKRLRLTALATKLFGMAGDERVEKALQNEEAPVPALSASPPVVIQDAIIIETPPAVQEPVPPPVDVLPAIISGSDEPENPK